MLNQDKQSGSAAVLAMVIVVGVSLLLMGQLSQKSQVAVDRELHEALIAEKAQVKYTIENATDCKTVIPPACKAGTPLGLNSKAGSVLVKTDGTTKMGHWNVMVRCLNPTDSFGIFVSRRDDKNAPMKDPLTKKVLDWAPVAGLKLNCADSPDDAGLLLHNTCYGGISGHDALPYEVALQCATVPPPAPPPAPPAPAGTIIGGGTISGPSPAPTPTPVPVPVPAPVPIGGGFGGYPAPAPAPVPHPAPTPVGGGFGGYPAPAPAPAPHPGPGPVGGGFGGGYPAPAPAPVGGGGFGGGMGGFPQAAGFDLKSIFGVNAIIDLGERLGLTAENSEQAGYGGINTGSWVPVGSPSPSPTTTSTSVGGGTQSGASGSDAGCFFQGHFCGDDQVDFPSCPAHYHVTFRYIDRYGWGGIDLSKYTLCKKDAI